MHKRSCCLRPNLSLQEQQRSNRTTGSTAHYEKAQVQTLLLPHESTPWWVSLFNAMAMGRPSAGQRWLAGVCSRTRSRGACSHRGGCLGGGGELGRLRWLGKRRYLCAIPYMPGRGSFQPVMGSRLV